MKKLLILLAVLVAMAFIVFQIFFRVQNPRLLWETSPERDGELLGPRNQRYRPGGFGSYPDKRTEPERKDKGHTGTVFLGSDENGKGAGHPNSKAQTRTTCGDGNKCTIELSIGAGTAAGSNEAINFTAQLLSPQGTPIGTAVAIPAPHPGNESQRTYTVVLPGCGDVLLTLETIDDAGVPGSKPGIQTHFAVYVKDIRCTDQ
jgi:hypothetical protein